MSFVLHITILKILKILKKKRESAISAHYYYMKLKKLIPKTNTIGGWAKFIRGSGATGNFFRGIC